MIVVADTSPINYLVAIGNELLLPRLYREVFIPDAVLRELRDPDAPDLVRKWIAEPPGWLRIEGADSPILTIGYSMMVSRQAFFWQRNWMPISFSWMMPRLVRKPNAGDLKSRELWECCDPVPNYLLRCARTH